MYLENYYVKYLGDTRTHATYIPEKSNESPPQLEEQTLDSMFKFCLSQFSR